MYDENDVLLNDTELVIKTDKDWKQIPSGYYAKKEECCGRTILYSITNFVIDGEQHIMLLIQSYWLELNYSIIRVLFKQSRDVNLTRLKDQLIIFNNMINRH